jgi:hypothetical protein
MKKIYYIVSLVILTIFTSCDYNATNFPGFDQAAIPTNVATYSYALASADYSAIGATFTKIYTDSVSSLKAKLKIVTTKADSATINASIARINLKLSTDSTLVAAAAISSNRIFNNVNQAGKLIPVFLGTKYPYVDANSSAAITYNLGYDTTKIVVANKYTLLKDDYDAMGTTTNLPGQYDNFSSAIDPNYFIPIYLKKNYPYAVKGDIKLIRYKYYISSSAGTPQIGGVFLFDGTNWINYNTTSQSVKTFVFRGGKWLDLLIFKEGFIKDIGTFSQQQVVGTYLWYWGNYNGGCMAANAYQKGACESWLVSPAIDFKDRLNPKLAFDHAVNYGAGLPVTDLTVTYISTDYTNDVTKATWTKLTVIYPTTYSFTFLNSGKIDLTTYANKKVYIAFKYVSTGTALAWEVSNINITDEK